MGATYGPYGVSFAANEGYFTLALINSSVKLDAVDGFTALADPTRRSIVELLAEGEKDAGTIAGHFPISKPAISRHLSLLRDGGILTMRPDAQRRIYSLRPEGLQEVDRWLARYRSLWSERLDALETALREET